MYATHMDRYEARDSLLHQLDPRVKVVLTLLYILSNVLLPDGAWSAYLAAWLVLLLAIYLSRLSPTFVLRRSLIALPFALAAASVIFTVPGAAVASWQVGSRTLAVSDQGLIRFGSILVRSWLSVQIAILLTATTLFPDLMHALRHLKVPALLVSIIAFMYRYLFVLVDEARRLLRAREARSARVALPATRNSLRWRARVAGGMVGQLFLRSMERSDRVYGAMLARGYQGQLLTMNPHVMERQDWVIALCTTILMVTIQLIGRL